jgi:hypothetical protein
MPHHHHVDTRRGFDRRKRAARPGRSDVTHAARPLRFLGVTSSIQPLDASLAALGGEVRPFGKDHQRARLPQLPRHRGDLDLRVPAPGIDEAVGQPLSQDVDQWIEPQGLVHHHARTASVAAQELMQHQQRVALARVPAEHNHRSLPGGEGGPGGIGLDHAHLHARQGDDRPVDTADEPAHHRVVGPLHRLRPAAPTEAAGDP